LTVCCTVNIPLVSAQPADGGFLAWLVVFVVDFVVFLVLFLTILVNNFLTDQYLRMSTPLKRALTGPKIRQYINDAIVRQHNDYRFKPEGGRRFLFKVMFGCQFAWYTINWVTWRRK
jgi:hypothetical protein